MPPKDMDRWVQNKDGSFSRRLAVPGTSYVEEGVNATAGAIEAAEELGVNLGSVEGSGNEGRITKADVEAAAKEE